MLTQPLQSLTLEQETIIKKYEAKWLKLIAANNAFDKNAAAEAINTAYTIFEKPKPTIIFCDSQYHAFKIVLEQGICKLESGVEYDLINKLWNGIKNQLNPQIARLICQSNEPIKQIISQYKSNTINQIRRQLDSEANEQQKKILIRSNTYIQPEILASYGSQCDFCISELSCEYDDKIWLVFQSILQNCGWIITLEKLVNSENGSLNREKIVIICEKPIAVLSD
ncbi:hypothetical protein [Dulcicalothrix desertica]|uniref:hypothetical protein n=1 Tax=Dulcicalothrix desertica TaxID=32056 RepID=UPI00119A9FD5|nr:hypothetical protein [Dulcicalothrix desertica]TWH54173.1 hypothetical protein CAL7102_02184 [Dulcicalothrix desertica PCC 7102]